MGTKTIVYNRYESFDTLENLLGDMFYGIRFKGWIRNLKFMLNGTLHSFYTIDVHTCSNVCPIHYVVGSKTITYLEDT